MDPRLLGHVLLFVVLWLVVHAGAVLLAYPEVLTGAQLDGDGYLRLVRIESLLETGAWYDNVVERSNWPLGVEHHWTRPLDVLILALALPFLPFFSTGTAVNIAGSLVSPLAHMALGLVLLWAVRPLVPGRERVLVMLAMIAQPVLFIYGLAGRADHHAVIFLLTGIALGCALRFLGDPNRERMAWACGAVLGLGVWVSPEVLLPLLVVFVAGGVAWLVGGAAWAAPNLRLALGLVGALTVALVLERPPGDWGTVAVDRISVAHWTMAALSALFWWGVPRLRWARAAEHWRERARVAVPAGAGAVSLLALIHPRFFMGPWADTDPRVVEVWLQYVRELQPVVTTEMADLGRAIAILGPALLCLPFAAWKLRQASGRPEAFQWLALLGALLVFVPLTAYQSRFGGYVGIVFPLVLTAVWSEVLPRLETIVRPFQKRVARLATMAGLAVGFLFLSQGVTVAVQGVDRAEEDQRDGGSSVDERCPITDVARWLGDPDGWGDRPRVVLNHLDHGPEILFRTPHRVLAGPYHRNREGILDLHEILASADEEESRRLIEKRGVELILFCPPRDDAFWARGGDRGSLYERLTEGEAPEWIVPQEIPGDIGGSFLLFGTRFSGPEP